MLTRQLRELEEATIVQRKVYAEVPPKVEYSLTEFGKTLAPLFDSLKSWGHEYLKIRETK
jgi:DNA-binding HxlR family transcriptional regulator